MFGSKRRREERERVARKEAEKAAKRAASRRPNLVDAVREAISSPTHVVLRPPGTKIYGGDGRCAIGVDKRDIEQTLTELQRALGRAYAYSIEVSADCPSPATQIRNLASPGWRSYADEYVTIYRSFNSFAEFTGWIRSPEGTGTRDHHYSINISAQKAVKLLKKV